MALHASQRTPYDDMSDDLVDAFLRHDRLVRLEPPWQGGSVEGSLHVPDRDIGRDDDIGRHDDIGRADIGRDERSRGDVL